MDDASGRAGLLISLKGLLGSAIALLHNRLALFGVELAEERGRLVAIFTWSAAAFLCLGAGLVFLAMFLTVLFWDTHRLLVLGVFSAVFIGSGLLSLAFVLGRIRQPTSLFAASLAELRQDSDALADSSAPPAP